MSDANPLDLLPDEARPYVRLGQIPTTDAGDFSRSSGFGGQPFLAEGVDHPTCPRCEQPMTLLAQVAIDEAPEPNRPLGHGLLQVFYCASEPPGDEMPCEVALEGWAPFSRAHVVRLVPIDGGGHVSAAGTPFPARRVTHWGQIQECPNGEELRSLGIEIDDSTWDALSDADIPACGDKLGGWPAWVQGVEYPRCLSCGATMNHVLQIDSEDNVPIMFGDVGTGHVTQCPDHPEVVAFGWACA